jgi:hypothetical protein
MTGRWSVTLAVLAAFLLGTRLAPAADDDERAGVAAELLKRHKMLAGDLRRVQKAVKDIVEIREMRKEGGYVLNDTEKSMERQGRQDFHIFMERIRNDTLEVLEIYERVLKKQAYVDPIRKKLGRALYELVAVDWREQPLEDIVGEISAGYKVRINVSGDIDYRKTMSLNGEMSLLSILLYIENVFDAKLVVRNDELWFVRAGGERDHPGAQPGDAPPDGPDPGD